MQFLISPPASPPIGWDQTSEPSPCVDYTLVTALAKLQLPGMCLMDSSYLSLPILSTFYPSPHPIPSPSPHHPLTIPSLSCPVLPPPGSTQELHQGSEDTPSIVIVTPPEGEEIIPSVLQRDGSNQQPIRMSALPSHAVQTSRPPLPQQS